MKRYSTIRISDIAGEVIESYAKVNETAILQQVRKILEDWAFRHKSILK